jgi:hypothetical protein
MEAHTALTMHSLGLDKMMGEKKVEFDRRALDLDLHQVTLAES